MRLKSKAQSQQSLDVQLVAMEDNARIQQHGSSQEHRSRGIQRKHERSHGHSHEHASPWTIASKLQPRPRNVTKTIEEAVDDRDSTSTNTKNSEKSGQPVCVTMLLTNMATLLGAQLLATQCAIL